MVINSHAEVTCELRLLTFCGNGATRAIVNSRSSNCMPQPANVTFSVPSVFLDHGANACRLFPAVTRPVSPQIKYQKWIPNLVKKRAEKCNQKETVQSRTEALNRCSLNAGRLP